MFWYLHVSATLSMTRYSRSDGSVNLPSADLRTLAKALIARSALLLFQGTPSYSRNVKSLGPYLPILSWYLVAIADE